MPCYHPLTGYLAKVANESGKRSIVFDPHKALGVDVLRQVPCGRCIGCRLERSRQWAMRCVHEASLYSDNCFITLTFSPEFLPASGSLDKSYFQKFMKRLRKRFGSGVRYFHCGEYGEMLKRPHFHACLFNFDFPDKVLWSIRNGVRLYRSDILEQLWSDPVSGVPYGFATVGDVTFESAAYVARYCVKKITGVDAEQHYKGLAPEYVTMSRRPGIGFEWFKKWQADVFPHDYVVVRGHECKPARYYEKIYELTNPVEFSKIKAVRKQAALCDEDNSYSRLQVREVVQQARTAMLKRGLENEAHGL